MNAKRQTRGQRLRAKSASRPSRAALGFDAAVRDRQDDHLGRWPFAKEVYGVATTGPREWSVRIGVYGEWGTGKTSVLNFVESMAIADGHIPIRFNPWEYADRNALWRAFVVAIYREVERALGRATGANAAKAKAWAQKISGWTGKLLSGAATIWSDRAGEAIEQGLELLKRGLTFDKGDLRELGSALGEKRIIVLIDDLDRTSGALVPEMLFAIKEVLDVGGYAFVCAFDPLVVGEVLGEYHPGFGDGLKFLEKIIDYPRWLPEPTKNALLTLARYEIQQRCDYVPINSIEEAIDLLPRNPRALRQFIRLLELLRPQIERHCPRELVWPVILASNIVKIRYPRLAPALLNDAPFWKDIQSMDLMRENNEEDERGKRVAKHVEDVLKKLGLALEVPERAEIEAAMLGLAERMDVWSGIDEKTLAGQMHIAEAPEAVTWKEFDQFVVAWERKNTPTAADRWIRSHGEAMGRDYQDVYGELFDATIRARQTALGQAAEEVTDLGMNPHLARADFLLAALECLIFHLGRLDQTEKRIGEAQFEQVFKAMVYYLGWTYTPAYKTLRETEKAFVLRLAREWSHDVTPVIQFLKPFSGIVEMQFEGPTVKALYKELCDIVVPLYARQVLARFREQGFIVQVHGRAEGTFDARCLLMDAAGPLWGALRSDALAMLATAKDDHAVHQNAYELLHWFDYFLRKEESISTGQAVTEWLKDEELRSALWSAATAHPLNPRAVGTLKDLPNRLAKLGVQVTLPEWWRRALQTMFPQKAEDSANAE